MREGFFGRLKLDFGHYEALVGAMEHIHFEQEQAASGTVLLPCLHDVPGLVDDPRLTYGHKILCLMQRYFLLPFIPCSALRIAYALYGKISLLTSYPHAHGTLRDRTEIALGDTLRGCDIGHEISLDQKFSFYFERHMSGSCIFREEVPDGLW